MANATMVKRCSRCDDRESVDPASVINTGLRGYAGALIVLGAQPVDECIVGVGRNRMQEKVTASAWNDRSARGAQARES